MPAVSIIIVTWNSAAHLPRCLSALRDQTFTDFEIILVDNGSADDTLDDLEARFPSLSLQIEDLGSNEGFAAANNIGVELAQAPWVATLNADAFPEPDWLEQLLAAVQENPAYLSLASRQVRADAPDLLDGEGDAYHISGAAWRRGYNHPVGPVTAPRPVFSACAAAALYHRETFLEAGGFDEDYFAYFEDVDLGFRLRLLGAECLYVPGAVVHHVGSASTGRRSRLAVYYGQRNLVWTYFKDMPSPLFWLYLPLHLLVILLGFLRSLFTLRGSGGSGLRALWDAAIGMPSVLRKRALIQRTRTATWRQIRRALTRDLLEPWREYARRQ